MHRESALPCLGNFEFQTIYINRLETGLLSGINEDIVIKVKVGMAIP